MKLGLNVGYWGLGLSAEDQLTLVREAERLSFDSLWVAEAYGSDAPTVLAWFAANTQRLRLGSAILQIPARSPANTAMTAATLDQLSGGRLLLGLGASGPQVSEGFHGVRFARQLQRTREYVEVVRMALRRERLEYRGETIELPLPGAPGKPIKLTIASVQERIPILLAAMGPKNVALAGEIADGWLPMFFSPEHTRHLRRPLESGAERAGRSLDGFRICPTVQLRIADDLEQARDAMRDFVALYVGGMGSRERNFYTELMERYGFGEEARHVQELYLSGRKREAAAALPGELIDAVTVCGPEATVADRLRAFDDAGVDTLIVSPIAFSVEDRLEQLRALARLHADLAPVAA